MQRWTALLFAVFLALAVGLLVASARQNPRADGQPLSPPPPAPPLILLDASVAESSSATRLTPPSFDVDGGGLPAFREEPGENADAGATLADGSPAPLLAASAPKRVLFGVILVWYQGAQNAPQTARSREDALLLATSIATEAKKDFALAAKRGDVGEARAGEMLRGVLERGPEYVLFSLEVGATGGPVDSPKGFYIFKRIE